MIESRKEDHIEICSEEEVELNENYWDMIKLYHRAAPEIDFDEISLKREVLDKEIDAPVMISAITGGYMGAEKINERLAAAAEELGMPFGVGSQRPALEDEGLRESYELIDDYDIPLVFGNIGAPQLISQGDNKPFGEDKCREALEMIGGDLLAIHFNYLQEVIQPEGDHRADGILQRMKELSDELPLIAKETGAGVSSTMALKLEEAGASAIDVGGMGGTSFSAVEYHRTEQREKKEMARNLWKWGIPTPVSILECRNSVDIPIISTGGIRNGVQAAKALILGADVAGIAGGLLPSVKESKEDVISYLNKIINEIKVVMFLLGCQKVGDLQERRAVITRELRDWLTS